MVYVYVLPDGSMTPVTISPKPEGAQVVFVSRADYLAKRIKGGS